jgi:hypothetical protein
MNNIKLALMKDSTVSISSIDIETEIRQIKNEKNEFKRKAEILADDVITEEKLHV